MQKGIAMRKLIIIFTSILALSGCQLLSDPNALLQNGNTLTNSSLDIAIEANEEYTYQGQYHYEEFYKFDNDVGGTVHVGNLAVYQNVNTHTFVMVHKKTCNRRCTFSTTSNVEEDESPSSFWVSGRKIFKRNGKINLSKDSDIIELLTFKDKEFHNENIFNTSGYTSALGNSYFQVLVATPIGQPMVKVKDVITLSEI